MTRDEILDILEKVEIQTHENVELFTRKRFKNVAVKQAIAYLEGYVDGIKCARHVLSE
jgi:hypothetical protein